MTNTVGVCALCRVLGNLHDSHFLPKGLYRLLRKVSKRENSHPLRLVDGDRKQTSQQAREYLLCADCETRFDRGGESWMLRHLYRGRGVFRLRAIVQACPPLYSESGITMHSAESLPKGSIGQIVYFSASVIWRASICDWWAADKKYEALSLGSYQEEFRSYLLGQGEFPQAAVLTVVLSSLERPVIAFNFPVPSRLDGCRCHTLHVPGITLQMMLGKRLPDGATELCVLRGPSHPIFVSDTGDAYAQRGLLIAMGRNPPRAGAMPVAEGII